MFERARMGLIVSLATALVGCAADPAHDGSAKMTAEALTPTELAAYSASHAYPTTQPSDDLRMAAIISSDRSILRIYNFSNNPQADVEVWVNGSWVQHVRGIGANASVSIKTTDLYNAFGKNFAGQAEPVTKVQLRIGSNFYNALGPVSQ